MQWLPWVLLFLGAALFWRDLAATVKPRVLRLIADCKAAGGAAKSALGGRLAMLLIGVVIGTFTPQVVGWVRANGWQIPWPNLPNIVVPVKSKDWVIVYESSKADTSLKLALAGLRDGQAAEQLKAAGHALTIIDADAKGANDQPLPLAVEFRRDNPTIALPALAAIVGGKATNAVPLESGIDAATIVGRITR